MKKLAWFTCAFAIGTLAIMGANACSSASSSAGTDAAVADASKHDGDGREAAEDSTPEDAYDSSDDGSADAQGSASGDADAGVTCSSNGAGSFTCSNGSPGSTESSLCNACLQKSCCDPWCTCAADSVVGDAGSSVGCVGFVACVVECIWGNAEAGIPPAGGSFPETQCATECSLGSTYTAQQQQQGLILIGCLGGSCNTSITCGM